MDSSTLTQNYHKKKFHNISQNNNQFFLRPPCLTAHKHVIWYIRFLASNLKHINNSFFCDIIIAREITKQVEIELAIVKNHNALRVRLHETSSKKKILYRIQNEKEYLKRWYKELKSKKKKNVKNLYHTAKIAIFMVYIFIYKTKYILIAAQHISCTLACAYNLHIHLVWLKGFFHVVFVGVFKLFCSFFFIWFVAPYLVDSTWRPNDSIIKCLFILDCYGIKKGCPMWGLIQDSEIKSLN